MAGRFTVARNCIGAFSRRAWTVNVADPGCLYCPTHHCIDPGNTLCSSGYTNCRFAAGCALMLICSSGRRPIFERNAFNLKSRGSVDRTHSSTPRSPASCFSSEMFASSPTAKTYVRACVLPAYQPAIFALRISAPRVGLPSVSRTM